MDLYIYLKIAILSLISVFGTFSIYTIIKRYLNIRNSTGTLLLLLLLESSLFVIDYFISKGEGLESILDNIIKTLEAIVGALLIIKILNLIVESIRPTKRAEEKLVKTAISVLNNLIKLLVYTIAILIILSVWGINVTPILASLGVLGIAVGFALKDILENVISGILIFLDPPFQIGDIVTIDNMTGEIIEIGIRNTKIRTFDNNLVTVPNSNVIKSKISNLNLPNDIVRVKLRIGVSYDSDPEFVKKIIMDILDSSDLILKDPKPMIIFSEYGDFALLFDIMFWTKLSNKLNAIDYVNTRIWKEFRDKGIEIPYPIYEIFLNNKRK